MEVGDERERRRKADHGANDPYREASDEQREGAEHQPSAAKERHQNERPEQVELHLNCERPGVVEEAVVVHAEPTLQIQQVREGERG
jgi:hypothetical protein